MVGRPKVQIYPGAQNVKSVPAPIGGINARDSVASMAPIDAVHMVNWIPDALGVRCRKGFREWCGEVPLTGAETVKPVSSVFGYLSRTDTFPQDVFLTDPVEMPGKLFAATDNAIYDVTTVIPGLPSRVITLSGSQGAGLFSTEQLTNIAGSFLLACSEADGYFTFDGSTWVKRVAGAGVGQINGADPSTFVQMCIFKRRAWFVQRNSTSAWYLPIDSIAGNVTEFDFGAVLRRGGHLAYLANWTIDAGEGIDDFLVAVGSNGDVAIYKGVDPGSLGGFALVGTWFVGQVPVGRRGFVKFGGDLVLLSTEGVFPISNITRGGADFLSASGKEYSSKIRGLIGPELRASFTKVGWQAALHPSERVLVINAPLYADRPNRQYVMSTVVNEWTTFEGIPASCIGTFCGYMFAGAADGRVLIILTGSRDNVPRLSSGGDLIRGLIFPAFSSFDAPGRECMFVMVRTSFLSISKPGVLVTMRVDYDVSVPTSFPPSPVVPSNSTWDYGASFDFAQWAGNPISFSQWTTVGKFGNSGSAVVTTSSLGDTTLAAIDYMYEVGGPL